MKIIVSILLVFMLYTSNMAQACCTAGTPLLGSLNMSTAQQGMLQFGVTYELNTLRDIYEGSSRLDDDSRERTTGSVLLEVSYGISSRFTITGLFSYVNQNRQIFPGGGVVNELNSKGIGDALIMLKYNLITLDIIDQMELSFGGGIKAPLGTYDLLSDGILIPADMQPGTGSWDGILWGYFSKGFVPKLPINLIANSSFRLNGSNKRFGNESGEYRFGSEFITSVGLGYRTDTIFDFSLFIRYRHTSPDEFNNVGIPNTGGDWLYIVPGINVKLFDSLTGRISGQLPFYRSLDGTQLTTSHTVGISFFYTIFKNNFRGLL